MIGRPRQPANKIHTPGVAGPPPPTPTRNRPNPTAARNSSNSRLTVFLIMRLPRPPREKEPQARAGAGARDSPTSIAGHALTGRKEVQLRRALAHSWDSGTAASSGSSRKVSIRTPWCRNAAGDSITTAAASSCSAISRSDSGVTSSSR
jgi:hypothetical protein